MLPEFSVGHILGSGASASVYKALHWDSGYTVALKHLPDIPDSRLPLLMSEITLLKTLNHPNIVQYLGSAYVDHSLYIILEYVENGSLAALSKRFGTFPESLVAIYLLQALDGLSYLHSKNVIHRDIKAANLLVTKQGTVKLADFGLAIHLNPHTPDLPLAGSPYWMAPEVITSSHGGPSLASDLWSFGCVAIELLQGKPPYYDLDPMPALFRIVNDSEIPLPPQISSTLRHFFSLTFKKVPQDRPTAANLLKHPWMTSARTKHQKSSKLDSLRSRRSSMPVFPIPSPSSSSAFTSKSISKHQTRPISTHGSPLTHQPSSNNLLAPPQHTSRSASAPLTSNKSAPKFPEKLSVHTIEQNQVPNQDKFEHDNWDADFEGPVHLRSLPINQSFSNLNIRKSSSSFSTYPQQDDDDILSGLVTDDDSFGQRVALFKESNRSRSSILHPRDITSSNKNNASSLSLSPS